MSRGRLVVFAPSLPWSSTPTGRVKSDKRNDCGPRTGVTRGGLRCLKSRHKNTAMATYSSRKVSRMDNMHAPRQ